MSNILNQITRRMIAITLGVSEGSTLLDGITHYYKLDETAGTTATDIVGGATGTFSTGGSWNPSGKINYGYSNTTSNTYSIQCGNINNYAWDSSYTQNIWIKRSVTNKDSMIVSKFNTSANPTRGWFLSIDTNDNLAFKVFATSNRLNLLQTDVLTSGVWYMITITQDGTGTAAGTNIYINGVDKSFTITQDNLPGGDSVSTSSMKLSIGAYSRDSPPTIGFLGTLDEYGSWDRALTSDEVSELYGANLGLTHPFDVTPLNAGLQHYYKFDETSGTNVEDSVGTSDITLTSSLLLTGSDAGKINNGLDFSSNSTQSGTMSNTSTLEPGSGAYSWSFWISGRPTTDAQWVIAKSNAAGASATYGYLVGNHSAIGGVGIFTSTSSTTFGAGIPSANIPTDQWNHIVITIPASAGRTTNTNLKAYLNGVEQTLGFLNNLSDANGTITNTLDVYLNNSGSGSGNINLVHDIDEIGMWDRALTSDEITALYSSGLGLQYSFIPFTPDTLDGLINWYGDLVNGGVERSTLSDATSITQWDNQAGDYWHVDTKIEANYPTYDSASDSIKFYNADSMKSSDYVTAKVGIHTYFVVFKAQVNFFPYRQYTTGNTYYHYLYDRGDTIGTLSTGGNSGKNATTGWYKNGNFNVVTVTANSTHASKTLRMNGSNVSLTNGSTANMGSSDYSLNVTIAGAGDNNDKFISELITYNRVLSAQEILNVEAWLTTKYSL